MSIQVDPDWWQTLFDEIYLLTDARSVCSDEVTRREVDLICELLPLRSEHHILDLCGGHGRHSLELCGRGHSNCTLLDYSPTLIEQARRCAAQCGHGLTCVQGDARDTGLASESFDHVMVMGNSLGYLSEPSADRQILEEAGRVLRRDGWVLVDVIDGEAVKGSFSPNAWHEIGNDLVVCRQREIREGRVYAREMVLGKDRGVIRDRNYAIKLYDVETIGNLLKAAGFEVQTIQSNFSSHPLRGDYGFMNRRILATGKKP
jgi:D-alanine-D-alanine ligase